MSLQTTALKGCAALLLMACILQADGTSLFPFGEGAGDMTIFRNDDDSTVALCPAIPYVFYGRQRNCLYVNNNGRITFSDFPDVYSSTPFPIANEYQTIAPFFGDVDTRGSGDLFYRLTDSDTTLLRQVDDLIHRMEDGSGFTSLSVTVATWNEVGYYNAMTDKLNTFQCVLASDGESLFAIFLYTNIEWIRTEPGRTSAQVGFNAGDGIHSYTLPTSQTDAIAHVVSTSNVGVPGTWVFKVSGTVIESGGCPVTSGSDFIPTCLSPSYGNQLGGNIVTVQGPYFPENANIQCDFNLTGRTAAIYESGFKVHCPIPQLTRSGRVPFRILIDGGVQGDTYFTSMSMDTAHQVHLVPFSSPSPLPLALTDGTGLTVTWSPQAILPSIVNSDLNVDIVLYVYNTDSAQWEEFAVLADNTENDGLESVTIPTGISMDVVPLVVQVATTLNPAATLNHDLHTKLFQSQQRVGVWSAERYYINPDITRGNRRALCQEWYDEEPSDIQITLTTGSTPCAPTLNQARLPTSGLSEIRLGSKDDSLYREQWSRTFHGETTPTCFKQTIVETREQECCYDNSGYLISGAPYGGSIKKFSKDVNRAQHFLEDVRPFFLCCTGLAPNCGLYYTRRPSSNGDQFSPPSPAWMFGDPHIVTLDGLGYTFNGYGEFILLETTDSSFTLQARMQPLPSSPQGTVFSALAARVGVEGDRVMITGTAGSVQVFVEDHLLERVEDQVFTDLTVTFVDNQTASLQFVNGVYLECRADSNGLLTTLIVGVPATFKNLVRGLLGVFNGDPEDDLTPAGSLTTPLPPDADISTIHQEFGMTWSVVDVSDSLFSYPPYSNISTFTDSTYEPLFEVEASAGARELCGDELFCLFDYMVTGDRDFSLSTLTAVAEKEMVMELVVPVICDPPCSNGACVPGNNCSCPPGFSGGRCETPMIEDCGLINPCDDVEQCFKQAESYQCVLDCENNPTNELCYEGTPVTNTATIIVAASCVLGGTFLVVCLVVVIVLMCVCCGKKRRREVKTAHSDTNGTVVNDQGHYHKTAVVSSIAESAPRQDTLCKDRKTSHVTLPPAYSELEMNQQNKSQDFDVASQYQNVQPPNSGRRASVGAFAPSSSAFQERLPLSSGGGGGGGGGRDGSRGGVSSPHMVISISPDSEASVSSPREGNPPNGHAHQIHQGHLSPIKDEAASPWYRNSTPSILSHDSALPISLHSLGSPQEETYDSLEKPHKSLQLSYSTDSGVKRGCVPGEGMERSLIARSSHSMGRYTVGTQSSGGSNMKRANRSIPTGMDHITDV